MGAHAHRMRSTGIQIIGGCCGNSPAHVAAIRGVLDGIIPVPDVDVAEATTRLSDEDVAARRVRRRSRG